MSDSSDREVVDAVHGEKMIALTVRFWTNNLAGEPGKIIAKHAWVHGVVHMERNDSHGIVPGKPLPFHSLMQLPAVIEDLLIRDGITLHMNPETKKYLASEEQDG